MRLCLIDPIVYSPAVMKRLIILEQKKLRVMKYEHRYLITDWPRRVFLSSVVSTDEFGRISLVLNSKSRTSDLSENDCLNLLSFRALIVIVMRYETSE